MTRSLWMVTVLAAAVLAPAAHAQFDEDPLFQPFTLKPIHGHVFVDGDFRQETQSRGNNTSDVSDFLIREGVEFDTGGSIYHPNLFDWTGQFQIGFTQDDNQIDDEDRSSDGNLLGYDVNGLFLRHKPLSMRVFSSYHESQTNRDFTAPSDFETTRNGVELLHRGAWNTSLLFERTTEHETSDFRDTDEETYRLKLESRYYRKDMELELRYEHEDTTETLESGDGDDEFPTQLDEVNLRNLFYFGEGPLRHNLSGRTWFQDRRGFFESQNAYTSQLLTLEHSDTFSTFYGVDYQYETSEDQDDEGISLQAGLHRRIYASLDLTARVFAQQEQFTDGEQSQLGFELGADYTKRTPIGMYQSGLSYSRIYESEESDLGERQVIGEAITLTDADFVPLSELNVITGSIVVMSLDRTITYVEGVHYTVRVTGAITEIQRLEFAPDPIEDGETVLVDYSVAVGRDSKFTDDRIVWSHRLDIESLYLSPYVILRHDEQNLTDGDDPGNLDNFTSITLGIDYQREAWYLNYEFETVEADLSLSYDAHRARARFNKVIGRDMNLSIGGSAEWLAYKNAEEFGLAPDEDTLTTYNAYGQLTQQLNRNTLWRLRADWRDISGRQNTMDTEISTGLEWRYRQLDFSVDARYRFFEQEETDGDVFEVVFKLKRYF